MNKQQLNEERYSDWKQTYFLVHLRVAEHSDKLLHEVLAGDRFMERSIAPIHQNVEQAQTEEDNTWLRHCKPSKKLVRHHLSTKKKKHKGKG